MRPDEGSNAPLSEAEKALLLAVLQHPGSSLISIELRIGYCDELLEPMRRLIALGLIHPMAGQKDRPEEMRSLVSAVWEQPLLPPSAKERFRTLLRTGYWIERLRMLWYGWKFWYTFHDV